MSEDPSESVHRVARLARLSIAPEKEARLAVQFGRILEAFRELAALDVGGAPEMTGPVEGANVMRPDEPRPTLAPDRALANAPERTEGFYRVPRTVGGEAEG